MAKSNAYLIPVRALQTLALDVGSQNQIINPYFDPTLHGSSEAILHPEELKRLSTHSPITAAVINTKAQFDIDAQDNTHLFGRIEELCQQLNMNSRNNLGNEHNAGEGVYRAIGVFFEFYNHFITLPGVMKKIPPAVHSALMELVNVTYDQTKNRSGTSASCASTCIASKRAGITIAISDHRPTLSQIFISGESQQSKHRQYSQQFQTAQSALAQSLTNHQYSGHDKQPLSNLLLEKIRFTPSSTPAMLKFLLRTLSARDLSQFITANKSSIPGLFPHLESLSAYFNEASTEKLVAFVTEMGALFREWKFNNQLIATWLPSLLDQLDISHRPALMEGLVHIGHFKIVQVIEELNRLSETKRKNLFELFQPSFWEQLINNEKDLTHLLRHIDAQYHTFVYQALAPKLSTILRSALAIQHAWAHLPLPAQTAYVEHALNSGTVNTSIGQDAKSFREFMRLAPSLRIRIYDAMREKLPAMSFTLDDFCKVAEFIPSERQEDFYSLLRSRILSFLFWPDAWNLVFKFIASDELKYRLYEEFEGIRYVALEDSTTETFNSAIQFLPETARNELYQQHHQRLFMRGQYTPSQFSKIVQYLSPELREQAFSQYATCFLTPQISADDFYYITQFLSQEHAMKLYKQYLHFVPEHLARSNLSPSQQNVCQKITAVMIQYQYCPEKPRSWHFFEAKTHQTSDKGSTLKMRILIDLVDSLEQARTEADLEVLLRAIRSEGPYAVLKKAQGLDFTTHFGLRKTASIITFEKMVKEKRVELRNNPPEYTNRPPS